MGPACEPALSFCAEQATRHVMRTLVVGVALFWLPQILGAQVLPSEPNRREAIEHFWSGQEWLASERWERAATEFELALKLHPLLTDAYYGLGQANMGRKRYVEAALAFQRCLEAARNVHALRDRARIEADQQVLDEVDEVRDTIR